MSGATRFFGFLVLVLVSLGRPRVPTNRITSLRRPNQSHHFPPPNPPIKSIRNVSVPPENDAAIKMEVGIEDCLHIEFEYAKAKYHLRDCVVGKIHFLLVRIKIKHMELEIRRRESTGAGANTYNESETVAKFEVMDGAPVKGEVRRETETSPHTTPFARCTSFLEDFPRRFQRSLARPDPPCAAVQLNGRPLSNRSNYRPRRCGSSYPRTTSRRRIRTSRIGST